jgi:hypothetical protein
MLLSLSELTDADVSRELKAFIFKEKELRSGAKPTTQYSVLEGRIPYFENFEGEIVHFHMRTT